MIDNPGDIVKTLTKLFILFSFVWLLIPSQAMASNCSNIAGIRLSSTDAEHFCRSGDWCGSIRNNDANFYCMSMKTTTDWCGHIRDNDAKFFCMSRATSTDWCGHIRDQNLAKRCCSGARW